MKRVVAGTCLLAFVWMGSGWLLGDDPKSDTPAPVVSKRLPPNWSKLGLSDVQKEKLFSIHATHQAKIDVLEKQIKELRKAQRAEMEKVLTDAQKSRLKEIVAEKAGVGEKAPENKGAANPSGKN